MASYAFWLCPVELDISACNVSTIGNDTTKKISIGNAPIGIAPIGIAPITNVTTKKISIDIATIRNDTITNATIGNDTNSYTTRNMSLASANKNRSNIYLPDIASPSSIYKNESMKDYSQENNVEQTYYRVLHVLWILPIFTIALFYVSRKKSVRINANWKGRRVQRCQSWPVCRSNKKCIRSRSKSVPIDVSVFDGINNLAEKQNAADL